MKSKRILLMILSLAIIAQLAMSAQSYPGIRSGTAECLDCHNEPATTGYDPRTANDNVVIDGLDDDSVWDETNGKRMYIPIANYLPTDDGHHHFEFARTTFAQNETHIFLMVRIHDEDNSVNGVNQFDYTIGDKLAIMWNINASTTGQGFGQGMQEDFETGEAVDLWTWNPTTEESYTGSDAQMLTGNAVDGHYAPYKDSDVQDVTMAANWRSGRSGYDYYVEIARPLVTEDVNDVQFDHTGYYEFSVAIWLESSAAGHYVSFPHQLWVTNGPISGYDTVGTETVYDTEYVYNETVVETETVDNGQTVVVTEDNVVDTVYEIGNEVTETVYEQNSEAPIDMGIIAASIALTTGIMVIFRKRR